MDIDTWRVTIRVFASDLDASLIPPSGQYLHYEDIIKLPPIPGIKEVRQLKDLIYTGLLDASAEEQRGGKEELVDLRRVSGIVISKVWLVVTHGGELMWWKVHKNNLDQMLERLKEDNGAVLAVEGRF